VKITNIARQRIDCDEPLLAVLGKSGHDYYVKTVNTDDGNIVEYYRGRSLSTANIYYDGTIARLEIAD